MPRSKQLHYVQRNVDLTQPNDPEENWASGVIQVDANLSSKFGRTIRNGNKFRLVGYGLTLRGKDGRDEVDTGFAATLGINYCPVTKHSVEAQQSLYKEWRKQQKLAGIYGKNVRYDDFEIGWEGPSLLLDPARNSRIHASGLFDTHDNVEYIAIYGDSSSGSHLSLKDYWNNRQPIPAASSTEFGTVIKTPKFTAEFPDPPTLYASSTFSSIAETETVTQLVGGEATSPLTWLPSDNHIAHLTGTLYYYIKGIPGDTATQFADELTAIITLVYEGWSPLNSAAAMNWSSKKSRKKSRSKTSGTSKRKSNRKGRR